MWSRFAHDFLDQESNREYNNLKHGFRVVPGGFSLSFGLEERYGEPAPPERMHNLGGSPFGSSYYFDTGLGIAANHFSLESRSRNWVPENMVHGLRLIALSQENIRAWLRAFNKDDISDCKFITPQDMAYFDMPWRKQVGVLSSSMGLKVDPRDVRKISDEEIMKVYRLDDESCPQ